MIKYVDKYDLKAKIVLGYNLLPTGVLTVVGDLKEDPGGIRIDTRELASLIYTNLETHLNPELTEYFKGELEVVVRDDLPPEVIENPDEPDTPDPEEEMYGFGFKEEGKYKGPIHISGHYPQRFVWPKDGPEYGKKIMIMAEDGQKMYVNDTSKGYEIGKGNRKYVAGYPYFKSNDPSQPHQTMEYYADYSTKPKRAWVFYGSPKPDDTSGKKVIRVMNTGKKMSWNGEPYDKFVFNRKGPEYTKQPFEIVFADGNKLFIRDPKRMNMTPDNMKYQPGGEYSGNNPDIPTMECYARKGTHPEWCEARFQHTVEEADTPPPQPDKPEEDKYNFRVVFKGDKSLGWSGHEGRDRMWWTKIHGGSHSIWSQKFPLPRWIDDRSYRLDITYSDGSRFTVPDTRREFYMTSGSGPKYRHQDPNERDPKKMHPKVSAKEKNIVDYIDVKVTPN